MACNTKTQNIVLEGCFISFGKKNNTCVTPVFPVVESSSFKFSTPGIKYYAWVNDGAGVDPALSGYTGIEVDTSAATDESEVVAAFVTAIEAVADVWATISTDTISFTVENKSVGVVLEASVDVDSTFDIHTDIVGVGGDLGKTEDIEMSFEAGTVDITSSQSGETVLDKFVSSISAEISTALLEMTAETWANIVGSGLGSNYTAPGSEELTGYGLASINKSFFDIAGELVLHPVRLDASDRSRDVTFHKTVCNPESINFSSTEQQAMACTFTALPDETKDSKINLFTFGDSKADMRV